jgi:hypothetical protein
MRHSAGHSDYRRELTGPDPVALLDIPLAIILLSLLIMRAITAAMMV